MTSSPDKTGYAMSKAVVIPECNKDFGGMKEEISLSPNEKKDGAMGLFSRLLRLDSLGKKNSVPLESSGPREPPTTYYGVYIPCEIKKGPDEEALHVYKNKSEALELVRRYKLARFKAFTSRQDAVSFALRGAEPVASETVDSPLMGEKPCPFKAPSFQDMVALRKAIEAGLTAKVRDCVWDNPRFLISNGSTPAILQEGSRYNALHIAAKAMNAELCNLILTTVGDPDFVQMLYGTDADPDSCKEFAEILVDRYLNTPDKGLNETPLHFAAKFGAEAVVDLLTSFPQCNRYAVNRHGEQPKDIICTRSNTGTPETVRRIAAMLEDRYYVPVVHSEDDSSAPTIGRPFTPAEPPDIKQDPLSPRLEIRAYAGPMPARAAEAFRRRWKTPPRTLRTPTSNHSPLASGPTPQNSGPTLQISKPTQPESGLTQMASEPAPVEPASRGLVAPATFRLQEISKGLETVGRNLAEELKIGWKEYWPFLDTFTDLRTPEGLTLLENYLKSKYENAWSFAYNESCAEPEELTISRLSLGNISQRSPMKDISMSPMSELCVAMKTCNITDRQTHLSHLRRSAPKRIIQVPAKITNGDSPPVINHTVSQLLCIERTCQVFAKRIADALTFSLTAEPEVAGDSLKAEARHLQHTIFTYMDDERFQRIDFALIHSRLAQLVVYKLRLQTTDLDDINNLVEFLIKLRCPNDDIFSSDDERKPLCSRGPNRLKLTHVIDFHVRCLASFICEELTETDVTKGPAISETECTEIWTKAAKCRCEWRVELFERNSKKNASFRKNRSILSTSPKSDSFIRRLTFDHEIGDGKLQHTELDQPIHINSPCGDGGHPTPPHETPDGPIVPDEPALYTLDVAKCQVLEVDAELTEDSSCNASSDEDEAFLTASEHSIASDDDMADASDRALAEPFIYGSSSIASNDEDEAFQTASEHSIASDDDMADASDRALAEPFIYGEEPSKMDRLVFDAIAECPVNMEEFPNVYRWRHTVALYPPSERDKWLPAPALDDSATTAEMSRSFILGSPFRRLHRVPEISSPSSPCRNLRARLRGANASTNASPNLSSSSIMSTSTPQKDSRVETHAARTVPLQVSNWLRVTGQYSPRTALATKNVGHNVSFGF